MALFLRLIDGRFCSLFTETLFCSRRKISSLLFLGMTKHFRKSDRNKSAWGFPIGRKNLRTTARVAFPCTSAVLKVRLWSIFEFVQIFNIRLDLNTLRHGSMDWSRASQFSVADLFFFFSPFEARWGDGRFQHAGDGEASQRENAVGGRDLQEVDAKPEVEKLQEGRKLKDRVKSQVQTSVVRVLSWWVIENVTPEAEIYSKLMPKTKTAENKHQKGHVTCSSWRWSFVLFMRDQHVRLLFVWLDWLCFPSLPSLLL